MARGCLGLAPIIEHHRRYALQLCILFLSADIAGQFQPMSVGIEKIDGTEYAVIGRPDHIDTQRFDMRLRRLQRFEIRDLERQMPSPRLPVGLAHAQALAHVL